MIEAAFFPAILDVDIEHGAQIVVQEVLLEECFDLERPHTVSNRGFGIEGEADRIELHIPKSVNELARNARQAAHINTKGVITIDISRHRDRLIEARRSAAEIRSVI
jgi:hypothetical protein